jgi:ATP-binding cassette subfamily B protein
MKAPAERPVMIEVDSLAAIRSGNRILDAVTLTVAEGTVTTLVGPSGGGKSTVMSLLLQYWDVEGGSILIDGQDIATVSKASLRRQIAYVSQDSYLFSGTIRDNIAIGKPGATEEEVLEVGGEAEADVGFIEGAELVFGGECVRIR